MSTALTLIADKPKPRKACERVQLLETHPDPGWFQQAVDHYGRPIWFVRVQITGFRTRRYGPFATKRKALLFLDRFAGEALDVLMGAANFVGEYQIPARSFASRVDHYPIVEDELLNASVSIIPTDEPSRTPRKQRQEA
jgi:hypothetical protein